MNAAWPHGDPRDVMREVLSGRAYRAASQSAAEKTWFDYVREAVGRAWHWLTDALKNVQGGSTIATIVGTIVLVAVAVFLGFVIVRFVRGIITVRRNVRRAAVAEQLGGADARTLLERALEAAAAGRHHEAAALLWASALRALDELGRVRYDAARTPGEWRRAVRDPNFDAFARDAVLALFGDRDADATLVARMRERYDRLVST